MWVWVCGVCVLHVCHVVSCAHYHTYPHTYMHYHTSPPHTCIITHPPTHMHYHTSPHTHALSHIPPHTYIITHMCPLSHISPTHAHIPHTHTLSHIPPHTYTYPTHTCSDHSCSWQRVPLLPDPSPDVLVPPYKELMVCSVHMPMLQSLYGRTGDQHKC